jgi:hypothetical protein
MWRSGNSSGVAGVRNIDPDGNHLAFVEAIDQGMAP